MSIADELDGALQIRRADTQRRFTAEELNRAIEPTIEELRGMAASNPKAAAATRDGKAPLDLLEHPANLAIARAMLSGAKKYGKKNYRTIPVYASTYGAAIGRHLGAYLNGEDIDPDSGEPHLAMIGANIHVLFGAMEAGRVVDDRGPVARTEEQEANSEASNRQHSA